MKQQKDVEKLVKRACKQGFSVDKSGKHWKLLDKDGRVVAGISSTPSDYFALHRIRRDMKRAGVEL